MEAHPTIAAEESDAIAFRSTWGTRLLHFVRRWSLTLLAFFTAIGVTVAVFGDDNIVIIIALIAGLMFGVFIFALCSRSFLTRVRLTAENCTFGRRPYYHVIPWDDVMLVQVEQPVETVGDKMKLAIHTRHRHLVIWLAVNDALECFESMRSAASHAAAVVGESDFISREDEAGDEAVKAACVLALRRKARIAGRVGIGMGAWGLVLLALGLSQGITLPDDILVMLFITSMLGNSIACAGYACRARRRANAIEAGEIDPSLKDNEAEYRFYEDEDEEDADEPT